MFTFQITIAPSCRETTSIITGLSRLLPVTNRSPPNIRLQSVESTKNPCVLEAINSCYCYKWSGSVPMKCKSVDISCPQDMVGSIPKAQDKRNKNVIIDPITHIFFYKVQ